MTHPPAGLRMSDPDVGGLDDVVDEVEAQLWRGEGSALQLCPRPGDGLDTIQHIYNLILTLLYYYLTLLYYYLTILTLFITLPKLIQ